MINKTLTPEEYSNIIERLQFYQNKIERLERENKEMAEALNTIKENFSNNVKYNTDCTQREMKAGINIIGKAMEGTEYELLLECISLNSTSTPTLKDRL